MNKTIISTCLITAPLLQPMVAYAQSKQDKPNIVFILVDDLRWDAMGFTGQYPFLKTPNIDQLRKEGVHFQNTFCTAALSAPSRATILTGMFPQTNGVSTNQEGREFNPDLTPSYSQILQGVGYKTAFFGKWHMAEHNDPRKGWDHWCSFPSQGNYYGNDLNINGKNVRNEGYITDELNKYTLEFIKQNADKPFCVYLSHKAVHQPFTAPERHKEIYSNDSVPEPASWRDNMENKPAWQRITVTMRNRARLKDKDFALITPQKNRQFGNWPAKTGRGEQKNYLRCLSAVDEGIGQIYELLKQKGILDNTIIVFAGDNGFFHGEHGLSDKRLAYNESMRIPLVMRYPKLVNAGQAVSEMVLNADIAPTFLEMAGAPVPKQMQGKSVVPLLKGKNEGWRKSFLFTYWPDLNYFLPRITAIRTDRYLYSVTPDLKDIDELYDEKSDPAEMTNLAENPNYKELKNKLSNELEALKKETGYLANVARTDPEPELTVKTGKVFSLDFKNIPNSQIKLQQVKTISDDGRKCGSFSNGAIARIKNTPDFNPSLGTYIIDCVVKSDSANAVFLSSGSQEDGWALFVENGIPGFVVCHDKHLQFVDGTKSVKGKWSHIVAVIENYNNYMRLYVDGKFIGQRQILLPIHTIRGANGDIIIGKDADNLIDPKEISKYPFTGLIQKLSIYREKMSEQKLIELSKSDFNQTTK